MHPERKAMLMSFFMTVGCLGAIAYSADQHWLIPGVVGLIGYCLNVSPLFTYKSPMRQ